MCKMQQQNSYAPILSHENILFLLCLCCWHTLRAVKVQDCTTSTGLSYFHVLIKGNNCLMIIAESLNNGICETL